MAGGFRRCCCAPGECGCCMPPNFTTCQNLSSVQACQDIGGFPFPECVPCHFANCAIVGACNICEPNTRPNLMVVEIFGAKFCRTNYIPDNCDLRLGAVRRQMLEDCLDGLEALINNTFVLASVFNQPCVWRFSGFLPAPDVFIPISNCNEAEPPIQPGCCFGCGPSGGGQPTILISIRATLSHIPFQGLGFKLEITSPGFGATPVLNIFNNGGAPPYPCKPYQFTYLVDQGECNPDATPWATPLWDGGANVQWV